MLDLLLVEDDPAVLDALRMLLQRAGYRVHACADARTALAAVAQRRFDVVLTDYHLGDEDGRWLLRRLAREAPSPRRVLMSGDPDLDGAQLRHAPEIHAFLTKPVDPHELLRELRPRSAHPAHAPVPPG
jgi:DNA-binding NtrC family response regulator